MFKKGRDVRAGEGDDVLVGYFFRSCMIDKCEEELNLEFLAMKSKRRVRRLRILCIS